MEWSEEARARLAGWLPEDGQLGKDIAAALSRIEAQDRELAEALAELRGLTPGGSEFQTSQECAAFVRQERSDRLETIKRFKRQADEARAEVERGFSQEHFETCPALALRAKVERLTQERDLKRDEARESSLRAKHFMERADKAEAALAALGTEMAHLQDAVLPSRLIGSAALRGPAPVPNGRGKDGEKVRHDMLDEQDRLTRELAEAREQLRTSVEGGRLVLADLAEARAEAERLREIRKLKDNHIRTLEDEVFGAVKKQVESWPEWKRREAQAESDPKEKP